MLPILGLSGWKVFADHSSKQRQLRLAAEQAQAHERLVTGLSAGLLPLQDAIHGRELFTSVCAACHGAAGLGVPLMGKDLSQSDFVARQSDEELRQFIIEGRPDAKPMGMPPKAGRDDLTDEDLRHIVAYVRGLQDPRRMPELPAQVVDATPSEAQKEAALAAAGGDAELAAYIASGDKLFHSTCIACHGKAGVGVAGNGKALVKNAFVQSLDDDGLLAFLKQGRSPSDAKNTTGIQMPPKGGNPALSDDDLLDIISYLRTLQDKPKAPQGK
jgi:disulfide bond formation protein DsbB